MNQRLLLTSANVYTISIYNSQFLIFTIKTSSVYIDRMYTELNSYNNDSNYKKCSALPLHNFEL